MERYLTWLTLGRLSFFWIIELPTLDEGRAINAAWADAIGE